MSVILKKQETEIERSPLDIQKQKVVFEGTKQGQLIILQTLFSPCSAVDQTRLANIKNEMNQSPLHVACISGADDIAAFLLEHKANANLRDAAGITPIRYAIRESKYKCIQVLLSKAKFINLTDADEVSK